MIRRLVAAVGLVTLFSGVAAALAPSSFASDRDGNTCVVLEDQRTPGSGQAICLEDYSPGGNAVGHDIVRSVTGGSGVRLPPLV
jgi:hypothetical protein